MTHKSHQIKDDEMRSYNMKKSNRLLSGLIMICLSVVLIGLSGFSGVYAAGYDDPVSVKVPYKLTYDAEKNRTNDSFDFQIKPTKGAPMPSGSKNGAYSFTIKAVPGSTVSGNLNLSIVFPKPGEYDYKVSAYVPNPQDGFHYDKNTYTLKLYVKNSSNGGLTIDKVLTAQGSNKKSEALKFSPSHDAEVIPPEEARPTTTPDGGGTVPAAGITPDGQPAPEPEAEPTPIQNIINNVVPKADPDRDYWSLLNVITAIVTLVMGAVMVKRYFERIDTEEDEYIIRREGGFRLVGIIPALASVITVLLVEDFTLPMGWIDEWTWLILAFFAVEAIVAFIVYYKYDRNNEDNSDGQSNNGQMKEGLA